jgi:hypothetical protein
MRIDIKSEGEVESERADAEAVRSALARIAGGPEFVEALEQAGFDTPRAILDAGREALRALPAIGDRADKIYAAAEEWLSARSGAAAAEASSAPPPDGERPSTDT